MEKHVALKTWADDEVITFLDEQVKKEVIKITGISDRNITYGDVKTIRNFKADCRSTTDDLKYFTGLERLEIYTGNGSLDILANCPNLTELHIDGCNSPDVSPLSLCPNLSELYITGGKILNYEIEYDYTPITSLPSCPNLVKLDIKGCASLDLSPLPSCPKLSELRLHECEVEDLEPLSLCPNLSELHLTTLVSYGYYADWLQECEEQDGYGGDLPWYEVLSNCIKYDPIISLPSCPNLVKLNISGDWIRDLSPLSSCSKLLELDIGYYNFDIKDLSSLSSCSKITKLSIYVSSGGLDVLSSFPNLTELSIRGSGYGSYTNIEALPPCPNLVKLDINDCAIDLGTLSVFPKLSELCIYACCKISNFSQLSLCPSLSKLKLVPDATEEELKSVLKSCPSLTEFNGKNITKWKM